MNLVDKLKMLINAPVAEIRAEDPLPIAVTTLLLEVASADHDLSDDELSRIRSGIVKRFDMPEAEADGIVQTARAEHDQNVGMFSYTKAINDALTPVEKTALLTELWELAFSDDELHRYEEHVIRRIAELLYVPHRAFIAAKHAARDRQPT